MSTYTTQDAISGFISGSNLISLTDDSGTGSIDLTVLNQVISIVSNTVDAMLSATYQVPFTGTYPTLVGQSATVFACEALYRRRLTPEEKNPFKADADMFREALKKIAQERGGLDSGALAAFPPGYVEVRPQLVNSSTA